MPRMKIWSGPLALAKRVEKAIHRWDEDGDVAENMLVSPVNKDDAVIVATFETDSDGKDTAAFADGYADGFIDGLNYDEDDPDAEPDDEDDPDAEPDDETENDEEDETELDSLSSSPTAVLPRPVRGRHCRRPDRACFLVGASLCPGRPPRKRGGSRKREAG